MRATVCKFTCSHCGEEQVFESEDQGNKLGWIQIPCDFSYHDAPGVDLCPDCVKKVLEAAKKIGSVVFP